MACVDAARRALLTWGGSLSEWGCIKSRPRQFEEMAALMSSDMTGVYSGGLMYEYSVEDNNYGIVTLSGNSVRKSDEFNLFKSALSANPAPTGNGGAASTTHAVDCPTSDASWNVSPSGIPAMPAQAQRFLNDGAGDGPGFEGDGSQDAGDSGTATASVTDGEALPTSDNADSAGVSVHSPLGLAPIFVSGLALGFALLGALLL